MRHTTLIHNINQLIQNIELNRKWCPLHTLSSLNVYYFAYASQDKEWDDNKPQQVEWNWERSLIKA